MNEGKEASNAEDKERAFNAEKKKALNTDDKERHKKQQRMINSLGSLLSGLDKGQVNINTAPSKSDGNLAGAGLNVTRDKGQQRMASTLDSKGGSGGGQDYKSYGGGYEDSKGGSGGGQDYKSYGGGYEGSRPSGSGAKKLEVDTWDALKYSDGRDDNELGAECLGSEHKKLGSRPLGSGAMILEVSDWDSLKCNKRQEEDELDAEWLESEHKKLDKLYGEGIITVMYTEHNTIGYNCKLCFATMNAMKCLEMHCNGMKHLKKKGIYEKNKAAGAFALLEPRKNTESPQHPEKGYNQSHFSRNEPDPYPGQERNPFPRGRGERGRMDNHAYPRDERDSYARDYRDPYARDYIAPYARDDRDPYARDDRDPYTRDDRDPYARAHYLRDSLERTDRHGSRSRSPSYADRYRQLSAEHSLGLNNPYGAMDSMDFRPDAPFRVPSPPPSRLSPPPKRPALELPPEKAAINVGVSLADRQPAVNIDTSLAGGPAAALLMKLSQCAIKNEKDAELASSIINLLLKSLKDYHQTLGEKSVADLMEQAEIKLGTAKAIRTIKKATPSPQVDAVAIALETLRRANSDVPAFASLI